MEGSLVIPELLEPERTPETSLQETSLQNPKLHGLSRHNLDFFVGYVGPQTSPPRIDDLEAQLRGTREQVKATPLVGGRSRASRGFDASGPKSDVLGS